MSDYAAQRQSDVCDKLGKSDKRTQSNEQGVCLELESQEFEKEERKETEEERKKDAGVMQRESEEMIVKMLRRT